MSESEDRRPAERIDRDKGETVSPKAGTRPETDPALNNPKSTPGGGMLPPIGEDDSNMQPSS